MSYAELMPELQRLPRDDMLRVIQFLTSELTRQEGIELLLQDGESYPVWTPLEAYDAAQTLLDLLEKDRATS
jgi:hypothetical protein